jgi:hypothetical protein
MENKGKKELLFSVGKDDLEISWFSPKGPGGQNKNKTQNACRIRHPESGAMATGQEERDRKQNLKNALHRLAEHWKFKIWVNKRVWEIDNKKTTEKYVEEQMNSKNLKVEILDENQKWVPLDTENLTDCPRCGGSGEGRPDHGDYKPAKQRQRICLECNGTGFVEKKSE